MKSVKIFDFEHELDLENAINKFIQTGIKILKIEYQTSHFYDERHQVFSFSAMIVYEK